MDESMKTSHTAMTVFVIMELIIEGLTKTPIVLERLHYINYAGRLPTRIMISSLSVKQMWNQSVN